MKAKELLFNEEARKKILLGVQQLCRAVAVTLGPRGRNVIIEKEYTKALVTKDGVTVAKNVFLKDRFENIGAQMVKEVAEKTADIAGDGTTTATILAEAIYRMGLKNITAGANPMSLKRGIDWAAQQAVEHIESLAKPVNIEDGKEVEQVATIAANGDEEIGSKIAQAFLAVGKDGVVTVEEGQNIETELKVVDGMQIQEGYFSIYFAEPTTLVCEYDNPLILLYDRRVNKIHEILPLLDKIAKLNRPLVIFCEDMDPSVTASLVLNKAKGILHSVVVKAPSYGARRKDILTDIAIATGGTAFTEDLGSKIQNINPESLGSAARVKVTKDTCTIIEGAGDEVKIQGRIDLIKGQIEVAPDAYEKEFLQERLAKLSGGVAVIHVGAATESEMKEKKMRVEDAMYATRAAIQEGIVSGGGTTLLHCSRLQYSPDAPDHDFLTGCDILIAAMQAPINQLCANSGENAAEVILKISDKVGYDFSRRQYGNLLEMGIIDPAKVVKTALKNASSIASLLLTTECVMVNEADEAQRSK